MVNFLANSHALLAKTRKTLLGSAAVVAGVVTTSESASSVASRDNLTVVEKRLSIDPSKVSVSPDRNKSVTENVQSKVSLDPVSFEAHWQSEMEREFSNMVDVILPYLRGLDKQDLMVINDLVRSINLSI